MASPDQMGSYYEDYPEPPPEPQKPEVQPGDAGYAEAMANYNQQMGQWEETKEAQKAAHEEAHGPAPEPDPVVIPAPPGGGGGGGGGAGKPAARLGDMCAHGGAIVVGCPTVMIGNKPAARVTDMHACPMVTGIVPHVGGPVMPPGSLTVKIGYMPAARMGDQATCVGPPDVIAMGEFTVLIG